MWKNILLFCFCSITYNILSQDIHFSNYYLSPLSLNPANTGNYSGNWRLMGNYRQQGENLTSSYTSTTIAFDHPVYIYSEKASLGAIYMYDNSADNTLMVNKLYLSAGFFQRITAKSYLHIGLQAGYVYKRFSLNNLTLPDQFDMSQGYYNSQLPTQDYFEDQNLSFIDLNWGLIWSRKAENLSSEIGVAMFHYNQPIESFIDHENKLNPKYQLHALAKQRFGSIYYIRPQLLYAFQTKANELLAGTDVGLIFSENKILKDIYVGAHYRGGYNRISDALIFKLGFKYIDFELAFAYDLDISGQKTDNFTGNAFELSLIFTRPETSIKERTIPCDIF